MERAMVVKAVVVGALVVVRTRVVKAIMVGALVVFGARVMGLGWWEIW